MSQGERSAAPCLVSPLEEKGFLENTAIVLDEEEVDIIIRAKKHFKEMHIFLDVRDVLKKIICDFEEELSLTEQDLGAEERAPDLFSMGNKKELWYYSIMWL